MSTADRQVNDTNGRHRRVIMLDVPAANGDDGWARLERPDTDPHSPDADSQTPDVLDVAQLQLHQLMVDVASEPPVLSIGDLLAWPVETRRNLFQVVARMQRPHSIRLGLNGEVHGDLFELVVVLMEPADNVARCEAGRRAAIEAAACLHPEAVVPCANRIVRRLRELGVLGVNIGDVQREIQNLIEGLPGQDAADLQPILDILPDAPVTAGSVTPAGWHLTSEGISRMPGGPIIAPPIVIVGRMVPIRGRGESLQLSYYEHGCWRGCQATRQQISSPQKIQALAASGLPVDSVNARELIQFLRGYLQANSGRIPSARASHTLGWQDDELDVFVLPGEVLMIHETQIIRPPASRRPEDFHADAVIFSPENPVAAEIADGVRSQGSYDGWLRAIAAIAAFPRVLFVLYASLAAPLLRILRTANFAVDLCGPTSGGKTTVAAVAASAWGNPQENVHDSFLFSWDSTPAFREEALATLNSLPCVLDETRLAERPADVVRAVYAAVKGRGRGRGHLRSVGLGGSANILISTGEVPIGDLTQQGGVRARTIPLWGTPFGETSRRINGTIQSLMTGIEGNFGFAGPRVVRNLIDNRGQWDLLRQQFQRRRSELVERAGDRSAVCRLAGPLATISIAAWLAHESLSPPWALTDPVDLLWAELIGEAEGADRAAAALEHALNWAVSHQNSFFGRGRRPEGQPLGGWAGRWEQDGQWLGFTPGRLRNVLREGGFDFEATVRMWCDRGWLLVDRHSGKRRHRARLGREAAWLVAIRQEAIDLIFQEAAAADTPNQQREQ